MPDRQPDLQRSLVAVRESEPPFSSEIWKRAYTLGGAMVDARSKPKSPAEIVNAPEMTQKQKIEVLDSWALDIERRLASTDEGMQARVKTTRI
jgi:hypothetical protein